MAPLATKPPPGVAERLDEGPDEPQHPPTVHQHLIKFLGLFASGCGVAAGFAQLELQILDPESEVGNLRQALLGLEQQLGKAISFSEECCAIGCLIALMLGARFHRQQANAG